MKILMIGAHQDDSEFRAGGLARKYVEMGYEVRFLSLTNGGAGHQSMSFAETVAVRAKESAKVAEILGIRYDVWDVDDGTLMPTLENRHRLIRYIREFAPDLIFTHRPNDYHADHRATGQLVQDASYLLIVPNVCPDAPALRKTPVILYYEDRFTNPPFKGDIAMDIDSTIEYKYAISHANVSQVYEWLAFTAGEEVPEGDEARYAWLVGEVKPDTTDEELAKMPGAYGVRFAKTAARFRKELIEKYGEDQGTAIRFAEVFEISEYSGAITEELKEKLFGF